MSYVCTGKPLHPPVLEKVLRFDRKRLKGVHRLFGGCIPLTGGKLNTYLADINEQATAQMRLLITQMAEREGVTEQLKAQNQMLWIQRMNNIRDRAMEYINHDLIYA